MLMEARVSHWPLLERFRGRALAKGSSPAWAVWESVDKIEKEVSFEITVLVTVIHDGVVLLGFLAGVEDYFGKRFFGELQRYFQRWVNSIH